MKNEELKAICCGNFSSYILLRDGKLLVWGRGGYGELGLGHYNNVSVPTLLMKDQIREITCGGSYLFILKQNGTLMGTGSNEYGQLGFPDLQKRNTPTVLMVDPNIKTVICGYSHSAIQKNNGELFIFGW